MMMRFALYYILYTNSDISLKQQSARRHVDSFGHINPIPSQQVFTFTP